MVPEMPLKFTPEAREVIMLSLAQFKQDYVSALSIRRFAYGVTTPFRTSVACAYLHVVKHLSSRLHCRSPRITLEERKRTDSGRCAIA